MTQKAECFDIENPRGVGAPWRAVREDEGVKILNPNDQWRCTLRPTEDGYEITGPMARSDTDELLQRIADAALGINILESVDEL